MHRRSLMALLGLSPVVAAAGASAAEPSLGPPLGPVESYGNSVPMSSSEILRSAFKAGLIDEDTLSTVLGREGYRSLDYESTVDGYKAFSPVAKRRLVEQAKRKKALSEFLDNPPMGLWDLARKVEGKI